MSRDLKRESRPAPRDPEADAAGRSTPPPPPTRDALVAAFRSAPVGMAIAHLPDEILVDCNDAFERVLGWPRAYVIGRAARDLGLVEAGPSGRRSVLALGPRRDVELTLETRSGESRVLRIGVEILPIGAPPHAVIAIVDVTAIRAAEESTRRAAARLRIVADHASDVIVQIDAQSRIRMVNRAAETVFGYRVDELLGQSLTVLMPQSAREAHNAGLARYLATGERRLTWKALELVGLKKSGEEFPIEVSFGEYVADGETLFSGVIRDVTARKHAELQIARLNRVHAVLSGISEAIVRASSPQQLFETACAIAVERGKFKMAWIGRRAESGRFTVVAHAGADADTIAIVRSLLEAADGPACLQTAEALRIGRIAICNDILADPSTAHWREAALARGYHAMAALPLRLDEAVVGSFNLYAPEAGFFDAAELSLLEQMAADIGFYLEADLRERRRRAAEAALRSSEERFREIAETIQEVFWITDASGAFLYVSPAYETVWGRSREALYTDAQAWRDSVHPDDRPRVVGQSAERRLRGSHDLEYRIVRPDGDVRWIRDLAFPVTTQTGGVERVVGVAADITDRKAAEAQMREAQKMESVGRLAAGLAHDFNNVLTVVTGIAELAMSETESPALREHLSAIKAAGEHAAQVTRQLLAFGRKQVLHPVIVDLNALVREAEPLVRRLLGDSIELVVSLAPDLGTVRVDVGQFHQVILNLVANSRDAMPSGGTVTIRTRSIPPGGRRRESPDATGGYAVLEIEDDGDGMDAATQQRIFEPFFTTKAPEKGSGLGLSTVHGIVKQSGGDITVASEVGRGTTMAIWLPFVDRDVGADAAATSSGPSRGHELILVVDDDAGVRTLARRVLERAGYTVLTAASGSEALELLETPAPVDLVLSDVVMPGMSGRELAERIRQRRPTMRVVFMTGYAEDAVLRHGVLDRGLHLIGKPYSSAELTSKIREALDA